MNIALLTLLSAIGLFLGMLLLLEVGRRIGLARAARDPEGAYKGFGAVEGAVFGLLGLLIAFTFSGAASRFDGRRALIGEEANNIGTAYMRIDLLPAETQPEIRDLFRRYLDTRLETYQSIRTESAAAVSEKHAKAVALQGEIWTKALSACRRPDAPGHAAMLMIPALNQMIDITTTRAVASQTHPPPVIFMLLGSLSLIVALLAGYDMSSSSKRNLLHLIVFAAIMSLTIYVILDLEYPRLGVIRIDAADRIMIELRQSMN